MANRSEKGSLFTDNEYLSKEEIQERYNLSNIDSIWKEVNAYREQFREYLPFKSKNGLSYYVVFNPSFVAKSFLLERDFFLESLSASPIQKFILDEVFSNSLKMFLTTIGTHYSLSVGKEELATIVNTLTSSDLKYSFLLNYAKASKFAYTNNEEPTDSAFALKINAMLQGMDIKDNKDVKTDLLDGLFNYLENHADLPLFIQVSILLFFIRAYQIFPYFNEESSSIVAKAWLSYKSGSPIAFSLPIELLIYKGNPSNDLAFNTSMDSRDLNYFSLSALDYLQSSNMELKSVLSNASKKNLSLNLKANSIVPNPTIGEVKSTFVVRKDGESTPPSLSEELTQKINSMLEDYPSLHFSQVHFYLTHNGLGKNYTIDQFRTIEGVSYETARTSLDYLTKLGFYSKSKIGKKFVYSPLPKEKEDLTLNSEENNSPEGF